MPTSLFITTANADFSVKFMSTIWINIHLKLQGKKAREKQSLLTADFICNKNQNLWYWMESKLFNVLYIAIKLKDRKNVNSD